MSPLHLVIFMLEHRQDPLTGRWVSIASARGQRPDDFAAAIETPQHPGPCPFCEGHECETPHEVLAVRTAASHEDAPGWQVRVIANKYPAFRADARPPSASDDFYRCEPAAGLHEVIVESPRHLTRVTQLTDGELATVLRVYRDRLRKIAADGRWRYALVFKNSGAAAGASQAHLHSQLIALVQVPAAVQAKIARCQAHYARHGRTLWREMIDRERADGRRIVAASEALVALCPHASALPYEMLVLPQRGACHFSQVTDADIDALSVLLRDLTHRLESCVPSASYNWLLHTSPFDTSGGEHYHWHMEILPRATRTAGYEWATGYAINPLPPEEAAAALRRP